MEISLRQLRTFRAVMQNHSVSQAARALGRTQPSVSQLIAKLEDDLGITLFRREKGRMIPTPEAEHYLGLVEDVLERTDRSTRLMRDFSTQNRGHLRICCMPAASSMFVPSLLADFMQGKPDLRVTLSTRTTPVIVDLINSQQYDLGIAEETPDQPNLHQEIFELDALCALPANDPLADRTALSPDDLDGRPLAALSPDHPLSAQVTAAFKNAQVEYRQTVELQSFFPALKLVEAGRCAMLCDRITARGYQIDKGARANVRFVPFVPSLSHRVSLITPSRRPLSLVAAGFRDVLRSELRQL